MSCFQHRTRFHSTSDTPVHKEEKLISNVKRGVVPAGTNYHTHGPPSPSHKTAPSVVEDESKDGSSSHQEGGGGKTEEEGKEGGEDDDDPSPPSVGGWLQWARQTAVGGFQHIEEKLYHRFAPPRVTPSPEAKQDSNMRRGGQPDSPLATVVPVVPVVPTKPIRRGHGGGRKEDEEEEEEAGRAPRVVFPSNYGRPPRVPPPMELTKDDMRYRVINTGFEGDGCCGKTILGLDPHGVRDRATETSDARSQLEDDGLVILENVLKVGECRELVRGMHNDMARAGAGFMDTAVDGSMMPFDRFMGHFPHKNVATPTPTGYITGTAANTPSVWDARLHPRVQQVLEVAAECQPGTLMHWYRHSVMGVTIRATCQQPHSLSPPPGLDSMVHPSTDVPFRGPPALGGKIGGKPKALDFMVVLRQAPHHRIPVGVFTGQTHTGSGRKAVDAVPINEEKDVMGRDVGCLFTDYKRLRRATSSVGFQEPVCARTGEVVIFHPLLVQGTSMPWTQHNDAGIVVVHGRIIHKDVVGPDHVIVQASRRQGKAVTNGFGDMHTRLFPVRRLDVHPRPRVRVTRARNALQLPQEPASSPRVASALGSNTPRQTRAKPKPQTQTRARTRTQTWVQAAPLRSLRPRKMQRRSYRDVHNGKFAVHN